MAEFAEPSPVDNFYRQLIAFMKRVNTRGIKNANKHVLMASLTYNLKKYLRFVVKKPSVLAQVMSLKQGNAGAFPKTPVHGLKSSFLSHTNFRIPSYN